ncbi:Pyridoxal reductase like protein [Verticillium longisporum]|nr:Pyridoxal reductase like protein [Verticillium longisporum]
MRPTPLSDDQAFGVLDAAIDAGANYWNGGDFYGPPHNNSLALLSRFFEKRPEAAGKVVLNIKSGIAVLPAFTPTGSPDEVAASIDKCLQQLGPRGTIDEFEIARVDADSGIAVLPAFTPTGSPDEVAASINKCLQKLGPRGTIDEFEIARVDANVPYEHSLRPIVDAAAKGRIGGVSVSEVSANTIRRAAKVTKISSVEIELSLWETDALTNGITDVCAELDIPIVAYSPLGRGLLTGAIRSPADIPDGDFRKVLPRYQPGNFEVNLKLADKVTEFAARKRCTAAQVAIAWLLAIARRPGMPTIIPIPGSSSSERVRENCAAAAVELSEADIAEINDILAQFRPAGERYHEHGMHLLDRE